MKILKNPHGSIHGNKTNWQNLNAAVAALAPSSIFILTDTHTKKHCLPYFLERANFSLRAKILTVPPGENNKNIATCLSLWEQLSNEGADRGSLLINLGGGVVTDLGGFVAATFKRGIACMNIPTSLLAMVDAAVGGKTGVDLYSLKNQVGVTKQPLFVLIETGFLKTLPGPQFNSGMAEMLKHGLIASERYWEKVKKLSSKNDGAIGDLVWESIKIKNKIVTEDPWEHGKRNVLNYGHTLGHAIESYCLQTPAKPTLLHGAAVAIGMVMATYFSKELLGFPEKKLNDVASTLTKKYKPIPFSKTEIGTITKLLKHDKKNRNGLVNFVLLENFEKFKLNCQVGDRLINRGFDYYNTFQKES